MTTTSNTQIELLDQADQLAADAALEALLQEDANNYRSAYIDNDGFSDRVMQQIAAAPQAQRLGTRGRMAIVSAFAVAASIIAMWAGSGTDLLIDATMDVATETITPAVIAVAAILVTAAFLAIAAATSEN